MMITRQKMMFVVLLAGCLVANRNFAGITPWFDVPDPDLNKIEEITIGPQEDEASALLSKKMNISEAATYTLIDWGNYTLAEPNLPTKAYLELPHLNWAEPWAGKKLRVLYLLSNMWTGPRLAMEIRSRLGAEHYGYAITANGYVLHGNADEVAQVDLARLPKILGEKPWDVIVVDIGFFLDKGSLTKPDKDLSAKTIADFKALHDKILELVSNGTGLVFFSGYLYEESPPWWGCSWAKKMGLEGIPGGESGALILDPEQYISRSISSKTLPSMLAYGAKIPDQSKVFLSASLENKRTRPLGISFAHGKGRVAVFLGTFPFMANREQSAEVIYSHKGSTVMESIYALIVRSVIWAGKAESPTILKTDASQEVATDKPASVSGQILSTGKAAFILEGRLVDDWGETVAGKKEKVESNQPFLLAFPEIECAGEYVAQLILRNTKNEAVDFACVTLKVNRPKCELSITPEKDIMPKPGPFEVKIGIKGGAAETKGELVVELWDNLYRTADRKTKDISFSGKDESFTVSLDGARTLVPVTEIRARLFSNGKLVAHQAREVTFPSFGMPKDFVSLNLGGGTIPYLERPVGAYLWKMGMRYSVGGVEGDVRLRNLLGIPSVPFAQYDRSQFDNADPNAANSIFKESETPPYKREQRRKKFDALMESCKKYGFGALSLGDETRFGGTNQEVDRHPFVLDLFREHLKKTYGSLESLNSSWGSSFKNFGEVEPAFKKDVMDKENLASWFEFRVFMDDIYADYWRETESWAKEVSPDTGIGCARFYRDTLPPNGGGDLGKCLPYMEFLVEDVPWAGGYATEMFSSFVKGGIYMTGGGYGTGLKANYMALPWLNAIVGAWGTWHYIDKIHIDTRLGWRNIGVWAAEYDKPLLQGVGKLLMDSKRMNDGIALLYSFDSEIAGVILSDRLFKDKNNNGFSRVIRESSLQWEQILGDVGLRHRWITEKQMRSGALKDYKILLLPHVFVLSDEAIPVIEDFVKNGGVVVADFLPAIYDGHGRMRPAGGLKDVLGLEIKNSLNPINYLPVKYSVGAWEMPLPDFKPLGWWDSHYYAKEAKAHEGTKVMGGWLLPDVTLPAVTINRFGKGAGVYIGFLPESYQLNGEAANWRRLTRELLRLADVKQAVRVSEPVSSGETDCGVWRYQCGDIKYVGLVRNKFRWTDHTEAKVEFNFGPHHVYDVKNRKYLGKIQDTCVVECKSTAPALLAFCPYKVKNLLINASKKISRGDNLEVKLALTAEDGAPGHHVVHLSMFGPDGREKEWYGRNIVVENGKGESVIPFAFNDPAGSWKIKVQDAMSGISTEQKVDVR